MLLWWSHTEVQMCKSLVELGWTLVVSARVLQIGMLICVASWVTANPNSLL